MRHGGFAVGSPLSHFTFDRLDEIFDVFPQESYMVVDDNL